MLYKCIFLCFLFIIKRYGDDSKRYVVATKKSRQACCRSGLVLFCAFSSAMIIDADREP